MIPEIKTLNLASKQHEILEPNNGKRTSRISNLLTVLLLFSRVLEKANSHLFLPQPWDKR